MRKPDIYIQNDESYCVLGEYVFQEARPFAKIMLSP